MADLQDPLIKQLTKNLNDYEEEDLSDQESQGVVQVAYNIIKAKKQVCDSADQQQILNQLKKCGDPAILGKALLYLLNRNQQKYSGGGGLFGGYLDRLVKYIQQIID